MKCTNCGKRFTGETCPACGQSAAVSLLRAQQRRKKRPLRRLWGVITTLIAAVVVFCIVLVVLDLTGIGFDPERVVAYTLLQGVRSMLPQGFVTAYDALRDETVMLWNNLWDIVRNKGV